VPLEPRRVLSSGFPDQHFYLATHLHEMDFAQWGLVSRAFPHIRVFALTPGCWLIATGTARDPSPPYPFFLPFTLIVILMPGFFGLRSKPLSPLPMRSPPRHLPLINPAVLLLLFHYVETSGPESCIPHNAHRQLCLTDPILPGVPSPVDDPPAV